MKSFVNGQMLPLNQSLLSIHDAGLQHGVGLFETMQAFNGKVFQLVPHIERLIQSAKQTSLSHSLRLEPLCDLVENTLAENHLTEARIRLTITGGDLSLLAAARSGGKAPAHQPSVLCVVSEPTQYPAAFFEQGVMVVIADAKANPLDPLASHKTLNYWSRLKALAQAAAQQAGEALWFAVTNHLCGGAVSNAFLVKNGSLYTPIARDEEQPGALPSPVLPGITRACVLEIAEGLSIDVHKKMLTISDVLEADEIFLTNSSWQILPVISVEDKTIGSGRVGELTRKLRDKLLDQIASQTS